MKKYPLINGFFGNKIQLFVNIFKKNEILRIKRNFFSQSMMFISSSLIQILIVPLMILAWGIENYGIWIFFMSLPAILTLFNLNFATAVRQELILVFNKKKKDYINQLFSSSFVFSFLNILIFLFLYLIFNLFFIENFKMFQNYLINDFAVLIFCIAIGFSIYLINQNIEIAISAKGRLDIGINILNYSNILMQFTIVLSGFIFENINAAGIVYLIFQIIRSVIFLTYYQKFSKDMIISKNYVKYRVLKYIFVISGSYYFNTISYTLRNSGLIYLIGFFFSPSVVVLVSSIKTLFYFLPIKASSLIGNLSQYEYAYKYNKKEFKNIFKLFNFHISVVLLLLFFFCIFSFTIGPMIYEIWTISSLSFNQFIITIVAFEAIFIILFGVFIAVSKSINRFLTISIIEAIFIIIALMLIYIIGTLNFNYLYFLLIYSITSFCLFIASIFIYFRSKKKIMGKIV